MQKRLATDNMEPGTSQEHELEFRGSSFPDRPSMMEPQNEEQQLVHLRMEVALLLNKEQHTVSFLSATQCHIVINTFKRMQQARDSEILQMLKPFIDSLDELIPRLKEWKRLCEGSGLHQRHAELIFKLEEPARTELGLKLGSFSLEGDVLLAIEASNSILRALAVEKKYLGLSKPMVLFKRNVKQTMADIQRLLILIMDAYEPVPGARFCPSDALDATKDRVVLRRGRPFYVDPLNEDLVICGPQHPLLRAPGSEWNKWFKIPRQWNGIDTSMRFNIPDGTFRHLREQWLAANRVECENMQTRHWAFAGAFRSAEEETRFRDYLLKRSKPANMQTEPEIDFEHVEHLDWDMNTYLKMLDHNEVDYTMAPPKEQFERPYWYNVFRGADLIDFLHPGYCNLVQMTNERIDHPCEFSIFGELEVNFSKMRMTPEEANGALTPYLYEDAATGDDFEDEPEEVEAIPLGQFLQEGLYLDTRRDTMLVKGFNFIRPEFRPNY